MGLDAVELVMEVEDRFNVKLADSECARVRTVADLAALVISRLPRPSGFCPTARTFFELRSQMVNGAAVERRLVRPKARLEALFPSGLRRPWRMLRKANPRLPRLVASSAVDTAMLWATALCVFSGVAVVAVIWATLGAGAGVIAFLLMALVSGFIIHASSAIGWRLPPGVETVGDVVRLIAPIEVAHGSQGERLLAQQQVLAEVRRITSQQLGLPLEKVQPESSFVKDLEVG
jgi:acyl carrier protein